MASTSPVGVPDAAEEVEIANVDDFMVYATSTTDHDMAIGEMRTQLCDSSVDAIRSTSTTDHTLSVTELKTRLSSINLSQFIHVNSSTDLTFVKISDCRTPQVELSVVIADKFDIVVNVRGVQLLSCESLFDGMAVKFDSVCGIELLLKTLSESVHCSGITDAFSVA